MEKKISSSVRIISAIVIFIFTIIIFASVTHAGKEMIDYGNSMSRLRSISGESLAERYYQLHGEIYECMGSVIVNGAIVLCLVGIGIAIWLILPVITEHRTEIKNKVYELKETTKSVVQAVSEQSSNIREQKEQINESSLDTLSEGKKFCINCGTPMPVNSSFCPQCGFKNSQEG